MFFLLHQVFEDPKLNTLMGEGIHSHCGPLSSVGKDPSGSTFTWDLKLEIYLDHNYRDYTVLFRTTEHVCTIDR
ncbi:hypothetical protein QTO34_006382, partial [Cnephaeus nilssonii]